MMRVTPMRIIITTASIALASTPIAYHQLRNRPAPIQVAMALPAPIEIAPRVIVDPSTVGGEAQPNPIQQPKLYQDRATPWAAGQPAFEPYISNPWLHQPHHLTMQTKPKPTAKPIAHHHKAAKPNAIIINIEP